MKAVIDKFKVLSGAPKELWVIYVIKLLESFAYYSLTYILVLYLSEEFGYSDQGAGWMYGLFGMLISIYGIIVGFIIDNMGVRNSLILGGILLLVARLGVALTSDDTMLEVMLLLVLPCGEAFGVPVMSVGIRRYTTDKNRSFAFAMFYVVMNVGSLVSAPAVDIFRYTFRHGILITVFEEQYTVSAYRLLLLCGSVVTVFNVLITVCLVREIDVSVGGETKDFQPKRGSPCKILWEVFSTGRFWRFFLFIVLLIGVRFVFRHLDATFPKYMIRQFGKNTPYGSFIAINPFLIIIIVPVISAYTTHVSAFNMILVGACISSSSVFFLCIGPYISAIIAFVVVLSIGEAIWSPRLYEYTTMIAPKGREGTYSALSSAPNFVAKLFVGGLSGTLLHKYCPDQNLCDGRSMWLIIGCMTATSPILMLLLRKTISGEKVLGDNAPQEESFRERDHDPEVDSEKAGLLAEGEDADEDDPRAGDTTIALPGDSASVNTVVANSPSTVSKRTAYTVQ